MKKEMDKFLADELFSLTLMATVQRAGVYPPNSTEKNRKKFQASLRKNLERVSATYQSPVSEEEHINNVVDIADSLSKEHGHTLSKGRFRIGTAQKALNLYLKYMWCVGKLPEPPHCPFDNIVIGKLPGCRGIRWTSLDSVDEYRKIVQEARARAAGVSLPVWELKLYNSAQPGVVADLSRLQEPYRAKS